MLSLFTSGTKLKYEDISVIHTSYHKSDFFGGNISLVDLLKHLFRKSKCQHKYLDLLSIGDTG